jgi:thioredoxin 1
MESSMGAEILDSSKFTEKIINGKEIAIVDFFADWCMPCKILGPILDSVADNFKGKVNFYKLNVDTESDIAAQYNIMSIPSVVFFKNGTVVDNFVGSLPKEQIISFVAKNLGEK